MTEVDRQSGLDCLSAAIMSEAERLHFSNARQALASHSIHKFIAKDCLLKDCHFCADLKTIEDEMSTAYEHIFDLMQRREQVIKKPNHGPLIHRLPVEILALTFVSVKEAYDDDIYFPSSQYSQPITSPPLLVGAVCKKWRDITLRTPQLWTDIKVDLVKPADAQVDMVNEWARRSGALPVNIAVALEYDNYFHEYEKNIPNGRRDVAQALRSLAFRWSNVALLVPWYFCHDLFDDLEESSSISSFDLFVINDWDSDTVFDPIKLRHRLHPKCFYSNVIGIEIPFEWENLVHLKIGKIKDEQQALHIMRHAQNLRHWDVEAENFMSGAGLPKPTTYITNRSLIYFKTNIDIMSHLILPSLQQLYYSIGHSTLGSIEHLNSLSNFISRSFPPLQTFFLGYKIHQGDPDFHFRKLPGITSLCITDHSRSRADNQVRIDPFLHALMQPSPDTILPRLTDFSFHLPHMPPSSWSLFSRLFQNDIQLGGTPGLKGTNASAVLGRPLSSVHIKVWRESDMDKDTFLHLLAVKKSGIKLWLLQPGGDLLSKMAKCYNVEL